MKKEIQTKWKEQIIPDVEGLVFLSDDTPQIENWEDFVINSKIEKEEDDLVVLCGECSGHGSIGAIVAQSKKKEEFLWSFLASDSNPFVSIEQIGDGFVARSSSGISVESSSLRYPKEFKTKKP